MQLSTSHYRTLIRCGLAVAMVATPLIAYAKIDGSVHTAQPASQVSDVLSATVDPAAVKTSCDTENWPNYSNNCLTGVQKTVKSRQIALVSTDAPLTALPRVIAAPITSRHIVATDAQIASNKHVASIDVKRAGLQRTDRQKMAVTAVNTTYDTSMSQASFSHSNVDTDRAGW